MAIDEVFASFGELPEICRKEAADGMDV